MFQWKGSYAENYKRTKKCLFSHKNLFCCIWSDSLKKAVEEVNFNFKPISIHVNTTNVENHTKCNYKSKNIGSQLNNVCAYDIETYNKHRAFPYAIGFYPVSKLSSK